MFVKAILSMDAFHANTSLGAPGRMYTVLKKDSKINRWHGSSMGELSGRSLAVNVS